MRPGTVLCFGEDLYRVTDETCEVGTYGYKKEIKAVYIGKNKRREIMGIESGTSNMKKFLVTGTQGQNYGGADTKDEALGLAKQILRNSNLGGRFPTTTVKIYEAKTDVSLPLPDVTVTELE